MACFRRIAAIAGLLSFPGQVFADVTTSTPLPVSGPMTMTDGANAALGAKADTAWVSGSGSLIAVEKSNNAKLDTIATAVSSVTPQSVKVDQTTDGTTNLVYTKSYAVTATTSITRPADTTAYLAGDAIANSTSSPTTGGFTLSNMARVSGGSGILTDLIMESSDTAALSGEVWIYDSAVTAQNDNTAWSVSDADQLKLVAKVPFTLVPDTNNAVAHIQGLNIEFICNGSRDLRFLLKATGGTLTTTSGSVYTVRAKAVGID